MGWELTPEQEAHRVQRLRETMATAAYRETMLAAQRRPETRTKHAAAMAEAFRRPETRAKMAARSNRRPGAPKLTRSRVLRQGVLITSRGCWEPLPPAPKTAMAARTRLRRLVGPNPPGHETCHRCDNRICFRPEHVYFGTPSQNRQDMVAARLGRPDLRAVPPPDDWTEETAA